MNAEQKPEKESSIAKKVGEAYIGRSVMLSQDFSELPTQVKLAVLQKVPPSWIKEREIQGKLVPYLDYNKAQRILNFVFSFDIDTEILDKKMVTYMQKTKKGALPVNEAMVHVRFTFKDKARSIRRDIIATHKAFENSATAQQDCYKGAVSKAWTLAAYSFGIGSNIRDRDYSEHEAPPQAQEPKEPVEKSFNDIAGMPY